MTWIVRACLAVAILLGICLLLTPPGRGPSDEVLSSADLATHPVYSRYDLDGDDRVIRLGIQPFWIFAGNITEAMKRDAVLHEALRELGLEIRFYSFLKGVDVNFFLRQGRLHGGTLGDMPALVAASSMDVLAVGLTDQGTDDIVARRPMLVRELKGKCVGCPLGSSTHHTLLAALQDEGIRSDQVRLVPMDVTETEQALRDGDIDACGTWEPFTTPLLTRLPEALVIHRGRYWGFLCLRRDFAERRPAAARQILASEIRALQWLLTDREHYVQSSRWAIEAGKRLAPDAPPLSLEQFVDAVIASGRVNFSALIPEFLLAENGPLHVEFEFLKTMGTIPVKADWATVRQSFDTQMAKEILAQPGKYRLDESHYRGGDGHDG